MKLTPLLLGRGRPLAVLVAFSLGILLSVTESRFEVTLRNAIFDAYQVWIPRERLSDSVIVIAVDDASLRKVGQWPWPRTQVAKLIDRIAAFQPAGIGLDMLFAEADQFSPERMLAGIPDSESTEGFRNLDWPDFDKILGESLLGANVTLAVAGLLADDEPPQGISMVPMVAQSDPDVDLGPSIWNFPSTLGSIAAVDNPRLGHGLVNAIPRDSLITEGNLRGRHDEVIRRVPAMSMARGNLMPTFSVEVLRRALGAPVIKINLEGRRLKELAFADRNIPLSPDGSWWIHFSPPAERPMIPAHYFLDEEFPASFDPDVLTGRIILLGPVASGLNDLVESPLGIIPGVNVHAEAIDNVLDGRMLSRPDWALAIEMALFGLLSTLCILLIPILGTRSVSLMLVLSAFSMFATGFALFAEGAWLIDVLNPLIAGALVASVMIASSLLRAEQIRLKMRAELQRSKEDKARTEGTLEAAKRIQLGMLPDAKLLARNDSRFELAATMIPASSVGGDLYDFFKIDGDKLFFVLGDVAGKGVPASLFMALSKTLIKGTAQNISNDPGRCLSEASRRIADENPESLFVSGVACLLDLGSGQMQWCSAGHDNPLLVSRSSKGSCQLETLGGPALCVIDDFEYPTEQRQLIQDDLICLISDGVTEAENSTGEQYGLRRLADCLERARSNSCSEVVESVRADALNFVGQGELGDDFTIVAMRWIGGTA